MKIFRVLLCVLTVLTCLSWSTPVLHLSYTCLYTVGCPGIHTPCSLSLWILTKLFSEMIGLMFYPRLKHCFYYTIMRQRSYKLRKTTINQNVDFVEFSVGSNCCLRPKIIFKITVNIGSPLGQLLTIYKGKLIDLNIMPQKSDLSVKTLGKSNRFFVLFRCNCKHCLFVLGKNIYTYPICKKIQEIISLQTCEVNISSLAYTAHN